MTIERIFRTLTLERPGCPANMDVIMFPVVREDGFQVGRIALTGRDLKNVKCFQLAQLINLKLDELQAQLEEKEKQLAVKKQRRVT